MDPREVIDRLKRENRAALTGVEAMAVLRSAGIPIIRTEMGRSQGEILSLAQEMGFPVALKIASPDISHKSDVHGVRLDLKTAEEVTEAYREIMAAVQAELPHASIEGITVQKMAPSGQEVIIGMSRDREFGPLLMFGLGGVLVEMLKDVSFRIGPLSRRDAREMIRDIKGFPLLTGYRGRQPVDVGCLEELVVKVSMFAESYPEVSDLDINPILAYPRGALAVDARISLAI